MSWDLYLFAEAPPDKAALRAWFGGRPHYDLEHWPTATYDHLDTGVHFQFELEVGEEAQQLDGRTAIGSFNLNYNRPSFFGFEAARELEAFLADFDAGFEDPQGDGMKDGFSTEAFLRSWTSGNRLASRAIARQGGAPGPTLPTATLRDAWRWNDHRAALQDELGDGICVSRVMFVMTPDGVATAALWTDATPTVLPCCDRLLLHRDALAPRRWFRRHPGITLMRFADLDARASDWVRGDCPMPWVRSPEPSPSLQAWVRGLDAPAASPQLVPPWAVADTLPPAPERPEPPRRAPDAAP